jgi:hypothetical protein
MIQTIKNFFKWLKRENKPTIWDVARNTHAALLKEWNKHAAKEIVLEERFVTADGRVYYTHKNIADLGVIREAKLRELTTRAAFGITPQRVANYETALSNAITQKSKDEILRISTNFVADMKTPPELLTLCELGALLVFRDDERPDTFNALIHAEKVKAAQLDDNAQFFFAFTGWAVIHQTLHNLERAGKLGEWKLTSEADFYDYLQAAQAKVVTK